MTLTAEGDPVSHDGHGERTRHRDFGLGWTESPLRRFQSVFRLGAGVVVFLAILRNPVPNLLSLSQVALLVLVGGALLAVRDRRAGEWGKLGQLALALPLILTAWMLCTTAWNAAWGSNVDLVQAARDLRDLAIFSVGLMAVAWLDRRGADRLLEIAMVGIGAACAVELLTRHSGVYGFLFEPEWMGYRARAGFQGPNEYGALASIAVAMAVGCALERRGIRERIVPVGVALVGVIALVGSLSRGGLGGTVAAVGFVIAVFVWDTAASGRAGSVSRVLVIATILLLTVWGATMFVRQSRSGTIVEMVINRLGGGVVGEGVGDRTTLLKAAIQIGANQPIAGGGMGAFSTQNASFGGSGTLSPHNELAKAFAEGGIVAVAILALWNVSLLALVLKQRRGAWGYAAMGAVTAFLLAEQFFTYLVRPGLSVVMAVVLAAVISLGQQQLPATTERRASIFGAGLHSAQ